VVSLSEIIRLCKAGTISYQQANQILFEEDFIMSFQDDYDKAKSKGKTKTLTRDICTWEEEGQLLFGKVLSISPFTLGVFDTEVKSYEIETDDGIVNTVLGSATDKQLEKVDPVGQKIRIEYKGKKQLKDGKQVNRFDVDVF